MPTHIAYLLQQLKSALTVPFCAPMQQHGSEHQRHGAQDDIVARCLGDLQRLLEIANRFIVNPKHAVGDPVTVLQGQYQTESPRVGLPGYYRGVVEVLAPSGTTRRPSGNA